VAVAEWTLTYPGTELAFGSLASGYGMVPGFPQVSTPDELVDDAPRARADGVVFGRDYLGSMVVSFGLLTDYPSAADVFAQERVDTFMRAWRGDGIRDTPGAVAALRAPSGRVAFGRPRRPSPTERETLLGRARIAADFVTEDPRWYGPERTVSVPIAPSPGAGLVAPLVAPLVAVGTSAAARVVTIEGEARSPLWLRFNGPLVNPRAEIGALLVDFAGASLAEGESITVDARARTVLRSGLGYTGPAGGALTGRSTPISQLSLPPGQHEVILRGTSSSGLASVVVGWRDTFDSY